MCQACFSVLAACRWHATHTHTVRGRLCKSHTTIRRPVTHHHVSHTHTHTGNTAVLNLASLPLLILPFWEKNGSVQCRRWQTSVQNESLDGRRRAVTTNWVCVCVCVCVSRPSFYIARTDDGAYRFYPQSLLSLTHNRSKCVVSRKMEMSSGWMRIIHDTADVSRERNKRLRGGNRRRWTAGGGLWGARPCVCLRVQ